MSIASLLSVLRPFVTKGLRAGRRFEVAVYRRSIMEGFMLVLHIRPSGGPVIPT